MTIPTSTGFQRTPPISPTGSPDGCLFTLWTDRLDIAQAGDAAGIERIGVDLEHLGKTERQAGRGTWISPHTVDDLRAVTSALTRARGFARLNPVHAGSDTEIDAALAAGARVLMVPMVRSAAQAADFTGLVNGRAVTVVLVEHRDAVEQIDAIASLAGVDEIHIGVNDLSLSLGLDKRWAVLTGTLMRDVADCVRRASRPFGFGGIGLPGDSTLPVPSELIYAEHARLGATRALLSRSFGFGTTATAVDVDHARARLKAWREATPDALDAAHAALEQAVERSTTW